MRKQISWVLIGILVYFPLSAFGAFNQNDAKTYLLSHSNNPWTTMALGALNTSSIPSSHLANVSGSSAIEYAAPILAITALNKDPRNFGDKNLVAKLKSFHTNSQIGEPSTLNDDLFGILALVSAGESKSSAILTDAKNFVTSHQNPDGGWGFTTTSPSDTNMTAAGILALKALGLSNSDAQIQSALNYLQTAQNNDGGFPYDPNSSFGTASDSSSTAWVIWALNALNMDSASWSKPGGNPTNYLENTQTNNGFFEYQSGTGEDAFSATTTAYAVIALQGKTLPLNIIDPASSLPQISFRIEGSSATVCEGSIVGPTALDVVKNAAEICDYTYNVQELSFGPYLNQIKDDAAQGLIGWIYLINNSPPSVGAGDFVLKTGDQLLWFYGKFDDQPTRLNLSDSELGSNQPETVTVESFTDNTWSPLNGAKIYYGTASATTDANGQAIINPDDGFYKIFAEKSGFIRSNNELLKVGEPAQGKINLSVNVQQGDVLGEDDEKSSVGLIVDLDNIDFGTLNPGAEKTKTIKLINTGSSEIMVESVVQGDSLFVDNLLIDLTIWKKFSIELATAQEKTHQLKLKVPTVYTGSGNKNATLTFWAQIK
ncbi:MAG: prenyltransferase/squalene oxidase repeat-containing protein [bacterium]|nr:prenyltransferase/squalene oxidase repeat-containing protein [bacterium]